MELAYFPPLSEFRKCLQTNPLVFSTAQPFRKNGFQNRAFIPAANGLICLTVPVKGGREVKASMKEVKIDNAQQWQTRHWRTLTAAYGRSPWFEYYEPSLKPFYHTLYSELVDWNMDLIRWLLTMLGSGIPVTTNLEDATHESAEIGSIIRTSTFQHHPFSTHLPVYTQVFSDKIGFQPNVSILDLLFNEGKRSLSLLHS